MMLSLDTAYRSFGGEVEASNTPTICRLPDSRRHQLSAIALVPATADTMRLVQKELAVAQSRFRILVYRYDDCLNVMVAPAFSCRPESNLGQGLNPRRMIRFFVVPFGRLDHHERPPKTLPS